VIGMNATQIHMVVGTPHYSQPEQLKTRVLTPSSDVYSLGTILYELLSAHSPFHGDRPLNDVRREYREKPLRWLKAHAEMPVVPLRNHRTCRDLPAALVDGVMASLDKDPTKRPADAGAFANILGQVLHRDFGIPIAANLEIRHPEGKVEGRLFLPGSYRIGSGEKCEILLPSEQVRRVHAVIEWSGIPTQPHLRPILGDGTVTVRGKAVRKPVSLGEGDWFTVGPYRLSISQ